MKVLKLFLISLFIVFFVICQNAFSLNANTPECIDTNGYSLVRVEQISLSDTQSIIKMICLTNSPKESFSKNISVDKDKKELLRGFSVGDHVYIKYDAKNSNTLQDIVVKSAALRVETPILVLLLVMFILITLFNFFLDGFKGIIWFCPAGMFGSKSEQHSKNWKIKNLLVGYDNRFSNSKVQIALWFYVLISSYITCSALRGFFAGMDFVGGISIPQNLLLLSGLSVITFGAAKAIIESKRTNSDEIKKPQESNPDIKELFTHLTQDDQGRIDLGDFQMIVITLLAVSAYLIEFLGFMGTVEFHQLITLPDVDTTILASFGLGQGSYLIKKSLNDAGGGPPLVQTPETPETSIKSTKPVDGSQA